MARVIPSSQVNRIRSSINKMVSEVQANELLGYAPTEKAYFHTSFATIIPEKNEKYGKTIVKRGQIRTYKQAISAISKSTGRSIRETKKSYTFQNYAKDVYDVNKILKESKQNTAKRYYKFVIGQAKAQVIEYIENGLITEITLYELELLSETDVLQAFRNAESRERRYREYSSYDSTDSRIGWYALLTQELIKYVSNIDIDTEE